VRNGDHGERNGPRHKELSTRRKLLPPPEPDTDSRRCGPRISPRFAIVMCIRFSHDPGSVSHVRGVTPRFNGQAAHVKSTTEGLHVTATSGQSSITAAGGAADRIVVRNPATGARVDEVTAAQPEHVARAVASARDAQQRWATTPMRDRVRLLRRFHDLMLERSAHVLDVIQSESGKSRRDALIEIATVANTARYYAAHGPSHLHERPAPAGAPIVTRARVRRAPRGVIGLITPWNYPFMLGVADALPALLAGNAVVTKPSDVTPLSAEVARDLLITAGLDPDLFQLVHGRGAAAAQALIAEADYIGFTGSTATGRLVARACADRLMPCSLELGGKNSMIVLENADIDNVVWGAVNGVFPNSGQSCISMERILVHERIHDRFVDALVRRAKSLQVGWSTGWDTDMGSLISTDHASSVGRAVEMALDAGADVLAGGTAAPDLGPAFYRPTLLAGVGPDAMIHDEEVFGPVAAIERIPDAATAIELINASKYGLHSSIWGAAPREARAIARRVQTGSVSINANLLIYATPGVPMGGVKASGIGRRHAAEGILRYTHAQSIVSGTAWKGGYESLAHAITSERRAQLMVGALKAWNRIPGIR
jgi:succinate-semialdehyde dehydrogenase/glutarate-semialdehyde dehydrogenase